MSATQGQQRTTEQKCHIFVIAQFLVGYDCHNGRQGQLWADQTRSISYVSLVDPKSGERNKIACRIIKLWNNLINQSEKVDQSTAVNQIGRALVWRAAHVLGMIVSLAFVWAAHCWSCSKNKHWKQPAAACAEELPSMTDSDSKLLFRQNFTFWICFFFLPKFKMCGRLMAFFLQGYKKLPFIFRYYSNSLGNIKVVNMDFTPSFKHFMY